MADVPLNHMSQMSQVPLNQMPEMSQVPPNQMPLMPQVPLNQMRPVVQAALGPDPCTVTCSSCGATIVTTVAMQPSSQTHLAALLLCCFCVCLVCLPYFMNSCQNADHYCPNCDAYLGTYHR